MQKFITVCSGGFIGRYHQEKSDLSYVLVAMLLCHNLPYNPQAFAFLNQNFINFTSNVTDG